MFGGVSGDDEIERVSDSANRVNQLSLLPRWLSAERRFSGSQGTAVFRPAKSDRANTCVHGVGFGDGGRSR